MKKIICTLAFLVLGSISISSSFIDAIRDFNGYYSSIPHTLSTIGMYSNFATQTISAELTPYDVKMAYWVDGTKKERWIWTPPGTKITPYKVVNDSTIDSVFWTYPTGTVIAKNFYLDTIVGNPASRITIETRLLVKRETRWRTISYEWRLDQTEAQLYDKKVNNRVFFRTTNGATPETFRWNYPSGNTCTSCHTSSAGTAIGLISPNMNMVSPIDPAKNQLVDLFDRGVLDANVWDANKFAYASLDDAGATNEVKARSWFSMNCAYCHSDRAQQQGASHEMQYFTGAEVPNYLYDSQGAPKLMESYRDQAYPYVLYPGRPDSSRFLHRMVNKPTYETFNIEQMPPLLTYKPDLQGIAVISAWICELNQATWALPADATCNDIVVPPVLTAEAIEFDAIAGNPDKWLPQVKTHDEVLEPVSVEDKFLKSTLHFNGFIKNHTLFVTGSSESLAKAQLFDISGKRIHLVPLVDGEYLIRDQLNRGLYILKSGSQSAKVAYYP